MVLAYRGDGNLFGILDMWLTPVFSLPMRDGNLFASIAAFRQSVFSLPMRDETLKLHTEEITRDVLAYL